VLVVVAGENVSGPQLAGLRAFLELAARSKPVLQRLFNGQATRADLPAVASAAAELGFFELAALVRDVAEHPGDESAAKRLAAFCAGMHETELEQELGGITSGLRDLNDLRTLFGDLIK
jgi:hypothetical protein